jgi:hypothetical protein
MEVQKEIKKELLSSSTDAGQAGFLIIRDRRPGLGGYDNSLAEAEAKIYLACDGGATPMAVWKALRADGGAEISVADVEDFLDEMTSQADVQRGGVYLSLLAVPMNPQITRTNGEAAPAPVKPAFVELSSGSLKSVNLSPDRAQAIKLRQQEPNTFV